MADLITILERPIGRKTLPAVSARELHAKLGVRTKYADWAARIIDTGDWIEHHDYEVFLTSEKNSQGGRPESDAALSIQMAEHIAMMTRTVKGREVREYFRQARDERDTFAGKNLTAAEMFLAQAQINLTHERQFAALTAKVDDHSEQLADLKTTFTPPAGKLTPRNYLARFKRGERLPYETYTAFLAHCRRLEKAERFTTPGDSYAQNYYTPETLSKAYALATRQLTMLPRREDTAHA